VQELHVLVELDPPISLYRVFNLEVITWLEQNRGMIDKLTVQDRVDTNYVLVDLGLYLM